MIECQILSSYHYNFYISLSLHHCENKLTNDCEIARFLGCENKIYQNYLIELANGFYNETLGEIFFKNYEDAQKAVDWVESCLLMNKLHKEVNYE